MSLKRGFTLIELSLVVALSAILAGALVPDFVRSLHVEASRKAALEMSQIAEASRAYYIEHNSWPGDLQELKAAGFIDSEWEGRNPFGGLYALQLNGAGLDVDTVVFEAMTSVVAGLLPMSTVQGAHVTMTVTPPGATLSSIPVGAIMPWTSTVIPEGWLVCDGREVSRLDEGGLFAVIGTTYGAGNGTSTFNLPDLRGRAVVGLDNMGGNAANVISRPWARDMGGVFGEEDHTLTAAEIPAHSHLAVVYGTGYSNSHWNRSYFSAAGRIDEGSGMATTLSGGGSGGAHNTVQPSMALCWIIRA